MATTLDTLEDWLTDRSFIAGDRFSAADVYVGSHLGWAMMFGSITPRPAFKRYQEALYARPAHVRASALDDAAIPPQHS